MVWGVCCRTLRRPQGAEDAFQPTFLVLVLVLVRRAAAVVPPERVGNWLYGVARQTARKARATAVRRARRERQVANLPEPAAAEPVPPNDWTPLLDAELARLPDPYRAVVVLCDLEGRTRAEAARELGVPEGTVGSRLARARGMLASRLARHGLSVTGGAVGASLPTAAAGAPPPLVAATIRAAGLMAAGRAGTTGAISTTTIALTEGVLRTILLTKLARVTATVLLALATCTGGALAVLQLRAADAPGSSPGQENKGIRPKGAVPQKGEPAGDPKLIAGKWKLAAFRMDGVRLAGKELADYLTGNDFPAEWTFTAEHLEWPAPKPGVAKVRIPYRLDEKATPRRIDVGTFGLGQDVKYPFTTLGVCVQADGRHAGNLLGPERPTAARRLRDGAEGRPCPAGARPGSGEEGVAGPARRSLPPCGVTSC